MKIIINGKFLEDKMQGIVRYATLITLHLDQYLTKEDDIVILSPMGVAFPYKLSNIKFINYGKRHGIKWELIDLKKYLRKHKDYTCLNLCNVSPLLKNRSVTTIHDIMYRTDYASYTSLRNKLSALWHRYQYRYNAKNAKKLLTVSYYSKEQLEKYYPHSKNRIEVTPNGWDHVLGWKENTNWNQEYPFLKDKNYFFSLASLSKNKNGKWIIEVAKRNPKLTFAIGGKFYNDKNMTEDKVPSNVHLLGFVDDENACALIKHCRAFLFPSINEGFGIPPLEALGLGAQVVSSNVSAMPGILGKAVYYIDPYDYEVNLDELLKGSVEGPETIKNTYTWDNASKKLYNVLNEI